MAENENNPPLEAKTEPNPKKKIIFWAALFLAGFALTSVGNYLYLKATYAPPPPPPQIEAEKPVMAIDLGLGSEETLEDSSIAPAAPVDTLAAAAKDTSLTSDSLAATQLAAAEPTVSADTLAAVDSSQITEAEGVAAPEESSQVAVQDSAALKRSAKLAKIVENMPAEEAAAMLQPLSDDMVIAILLRLKQRQAAKIMAEIPAQRAAEISRIILEPAVQRQ